MENFEEYLKRENLSPNTIKAYFGSVKLFLERQKAVNKSNLLIFKTFLSENFKPKTVNLKIQAINRYLVFINKGELRLRSVRIQQKSFLENVISDSDYNHLKNKLKADGKTKWYFVVRFLGSTGSRISELLQIKRENLECGYIDLYTKGGKNRRIFIPMTVCKECLSWLDDCGIQDGYIFLNDKRERISSRGVAQQLKNFAKKYGIESKVVYPHSFRHRFAKNFLAKCNDIALLADLLGHESIETTRIYLRKTSEEQQQIVDKIVTW